MALRARPARPRKALARALPAEHGPRHLSTGLGAGAGGAPRAAGRPLPPARAPGQRSPRRSLRPHGPGRPVRAVRAPGAPAAALSGPHGPSAAFRVSGHTIQHVLYPVEQSRGYEATGDLWSPGYFRMTLEPQGTATIVASTEPWEVVDALDPETAPARRARSPAAAPRHRSSRRPHGRGRGARPGRGPVRRDAGGPPRRHGPYPRHGRRSSHDHRRLSLVHRLGPRHHDQPRGADAPDWPPRRGRLHPSHLRPLRPGRPDPQHVSRGHARGPVPHRRRHASGTSTRSTAISARPATGARSVSCYRRCVVDRRPPRAGHAVRHRGRPARRSPAAGRGRLPAHVDGRQGRRLGGDAAPRARRSRSTRSGTTPSGSWKAGWARSRTTGRGAAARRAGRTRSGRRSTRASGTPTAATSTT